MIVGSSFKGDNNDTLKRVQHSLYWALLPLLLKYAKQNYMEAANILGVRTKLTDKITDISSFDHRVLQEAHDIIAAYYRYKYPDKEGQLVFPCVCSDSDGKVSLEKALSELYEKEWCEFWYKETKELTRDGAIIRAILMSVVYQNTEKGYDAEELLNSLLKERYDIEGETSSDYF